MARRTKAQIQQDNERILDKKVRALDKLNSHLNEVSEISELNQAKVNEFIGLFLKCETVYKTLYPEMKKIKDEENIDVRQLKFNVQYFEAALRFFGIEYDHNKMNSMFGAKKSYLKCRDNIIHGLKIESINEVLKNYDEMVLSMKEFLRNVESGQPSL